MSDIVDREIDVYLSKGLAKNLYLFQYPTRPHDMKFDQTKCIGAKIKPKQQKVELEVRLDTSSPNYDVSRGAQIALNVDGKDPNQNRYFGSHLMDKQVLTSTKSLTSTARYAIGLLKQGELHLSPLHSILQLLPSFQYLDKSDTQAKLENSGGSEDNDNEKEEQATAVIARFAGPDTEKARLAKERSYIYLQQKSDREPWVTTKYHGCGSLRSNMEKQKLLCSNEYRENTNAPLTPKEYMKVLVPDTLRFSGVTNKDIEKEEIFQSMTKIKKLPLTDQMEAIMVNAKVLQFSQILDLLPKGTDPIQLERLLQQIAVMVQGCWVIKSETLYKPPKKHKETDQEEKARMFLIRARDYVMWCFTKSRYVTRKEILPMVQVGNDEVTEIISQMAKKVRSKGHWEFKYPCDDRIPNHPGVVQRQKMLWDANYKTLIKELELDRAKSKDSSNGQMSFPSPPRSRNRRRLKYLRDSISDDNEGSASESSSVERMEVDCIKANKGSKALKMSSIYSLDDVTNKRNGPKSGWKSQAATFDVTPTFSNAIHIQLKAQLINFVREKLKKNFCMTISDVKEAVLNRHSQLNRIISNEMLEEIILESGAQRVKNKWPQNNTLPEAVYAFTSFDNKYDRYREALLDLFSNTARSRPNLLVKKIEDDYGEEVSENDCRHIFEEYCVHKSGFYYLKGTIAQDS